MKMNPEIKAKWVADLTSGQYQQGKYYLRSKDDHYCCLGVLCDQYSKATGTPWEPFESEEVTGGKKFFVLGEGTALPDAVAQWAGLEHGGDVGIKIGDCANRDSLASLNDQGVLFSAIAELIKGQL